MNYKNQDLTGRNFDGQDLSYALFSGSNLTNCSFIGADLTGANMLNTTLEKTNFTDAIMNYSNVKNSVGTANWTNAKVKYMPKYVTMPGSDDITEPPSRLEEQDRRDVITAFITQAVIPLNTQDIQIVHDFMEHGIRGVITGSYGDMPTGDSLYESLNILPPQEVTYMLNLVIDRDLQYNGTEYHI